MSWGRFNLWLADHLAELEGARWDARLSADERAVWREELSLRLDENPDVSPSATECLLWVAEDSALSEVQLALIRFLRTVEASEALRQLSALEGHVSRRVQLRSKVLAAAAKVGMLMLETEAAPS
jgi:hypothetical protein